MSVSEKTAADYRTTADYRNEIEQREGNMRWNDDGSCPVCGEYDNRDPFGSKFCPNFGAKLDLEEDHGNQTDI